MNLKLATIVTGGGRGIGRAIALRMSKETSVILVGQNKDNLRAVRSEIEAAGGAAFYCIGDVSEAQTAQECLAVANEQSLTIRNLVCNAGIGNGGAITSFDQATWRRIFAVNVEGTFLFIKACLPKMIEQKTGNIVIMSSVAGLTGYKYQSAYCASKFALIGLAQSVAAEYAKHGIVAVPLCPGFVESDMTRRTIEGLVKHRGISEDEARQKVADANPQKRIIDPAEVAEQVALVCSGQIASGTIVRI